MNANSAIFKDFYYLSEKIFSEKKLLNVNETAL